MAAAALLREARCVLDTSPFGGYTTTMDALSVGTPAVTMRHAVLARGRATAAVIAAMARVDASLDADLCATIRALYMKCIVLRARLAEQHGDGGGRLELLGEDSMRRIAALNVVITLCGGYFNQGPREEWRGVEEDEVEDD